MSAARPSDVVRVYTHNIYARREGWTERAAVLGSGIAALDPDVILLQEEVFDDGDQTAELAPGFQVAHSTARSDAERSGVSIASRWPIADVREVDLTDGGPAVDEYRWATLIATIDAPDPIGRIVVANHFPEAAVDREHERLRQALLATDALSSVAPGGDEPVVLAGDFDAEPDAASLRFLTGREPAGDRGVAYVRAWDAVHPGERCVTLDPDNALHHAQLPGWPFQQIDHILVRCRRDGLPSLRVVDCARVGTHPVDGIWASDHIGVVADLHRTR